MSLKKDVQTFLLTCDLELSAGQFAARLVAYGFAFGLAAGLFFSIYSFETALAIGATVFFVFIVSVYALLIVTANSRVQILEDALPDFLTLMAGNIRSGLPPERALLISGRREEFGLLSREIDRAAKRSLTGTPFGEAFMGMTERVKSEMFSKTVRLIVEGLNSGGNLSELLERTAFDIRRFASIRKEVAATVLSYQLFMFAAVGIGAPMLYAVASVLIDSLTAISARSSSVASGVPTHIPFISGTELGLNPEVVFWFSILAIILSSFFGSLTAGVISRGKESDGFAYIPIILFVALGVFFMAKFIFTLFLGELFAV